MCNDFADFPASYHQIIEIMRVQALKDLFDFLFNPRVFQEVAIGIGGYGKAVGDPDPFALEFPVHFSERGVLPAHQRNICYADFAEPEDELLFTISRHWLSPLIT